MKTKCKNCGAVLHESLVCEYCGYDNSPEFRAKFDDKGYGTLEYKGKKFNVFISEIRWNTYEGMSGRDASGKFVHPKTITKRTFTLKEF